MWWVLPLVRESMAVALVPAQSLSAPMMVEVLVSPMLWSIVEKALPMAATKAEKMAATVGPSMVETLAVVTVHWLGLIQVVRLE